MKNVSRRHLLRDSAKVLGGLFVIGTAGRVVFAQSAQPSKAPTSGPSTQTGSPGPSPVTQEDRLSEKGKRQGGYYNSSGYYSGGGYMGFYGSGYDTKFFGPGYYKK